MCRGGATGGTGKSGADRKVASSLAATAAGCGDCQAPMTSNNPWIASEAPKAKRNGRLIKPREIPSCLPLSNFIALC
jgi:hypothetical protein